MKTQNLESLKAEQIEAISSEEARNLVGGLSLNFAKITEFAARPDRPEGTEPLGYSWGVSQAGGFS